jgi:hypothetical protein
MHLLCVWKGRLSNHSLVLLFVVCCCCGHVGAVGHSPRLQPACSHDQGIDTHPCAGPRGRDLLCVRLFSIPLVFSPLSQPLTRLARALDNQPFVPLPCAEAVGLVVALAACCSCSCCCSCSFLELLPPVCVALVVDFAPAIHSLSLCSLSCSPCAELSVLPCSERATKHVTLMPIAAHHVVLPSPSPLPELIAVLITELITDHYADRCADRCAADPWAHGLSLQLCGQGCRCGQGREGGCGWKDHLSRCMQRHGDPAGAHTRVGHGKCSWGYLLKSPCAWRTQTSATSYTYT